MNEGRMVASPGTRLACDQAEDERPWGALVDHLAAPRPTIGIAAAAARS